MKTLNEFDLISRYFAKYTEQRSDVILGIGDDCALVNARANHELAISTDSFVADVHFFANTDPYAIGHKSLAVNLSDLAAMGAEPAWFTLTLNLPHADENWINNFCRGFSNLAHQYKLQLIGGDLSTGPLAITVQIIGFVPHNKALRRDKAQAGDAIFVTGTLGDAGLALAMANNLTAKNSYFSQLQQRLQFPTPRVNEAIALRDLATAAIDISDGLAGDLGHILEQSNVGATIKSEHIPLSHELKASLPADAAVEMTLTAGDDYELCFTVPQPKIPQLKRVAKNFSCNITQIGIIEKTQGLHLINAAGEVETIPTQGYQHRW